MPLIFRIRGTVQANRMEGGDARVGVMIPRHTNPVDMFRHSHALGWVLDINVRLETIISSEARPVPARCKSQKGMGVVGWEIGVLIVLT